jgi:hypothetical protein
MIKTREPCGNEIKEKKKRKRWIRMGMVIRSKNYRNKRVAGIGDGLL